MNRFPSPRLDPQPEWPKPQGFPDVLPDGRALADYVISVCVGEVDEEFVEEFFQDCAARLAWVPMDQIQEGPKDNNIRIKSREREYARMPLATMPPLVVENGTVQDGNHRYRVARSLGAKGLWCYVIEYPDETS